MTGDDIKATAQRLHECMQIRRDLAPIVVASEERVAKRLAHATNAYVRDGLSTETSFRTPVGTVRVRLRGGDGQQSGVVIEK